MIMVLKHLNFGLVDYRILKFQGRLESILLVDKELEEFIDFEELNKRVYSMIN